jgi:hypothetical protein
MKKFLRWFILLVVAGLFLAAFFWEVRQSYSTFDHKVVEMLMILLFFGFGWVWCGYNELSSYQELFEKNSNANQHEADLAQRLFSQSASKNYHFYTVEDLSVMKNDPNQMSEHGMNQR